jgi:uncharacterized protein (TIRG00374 family)
LSGLSAAGETLAGFAGAGEIVRPMWLPMRDKRVRPSAAIVTLGVERIFDFAALTTFFAINLLWFVPPSGREQDLSFVKFVGGVMLAGVAFGFLMLLIYAKFSALVIGWFERATERKFVPQRLRRIFLSLMRQLAAALQILRDWREIVSVVFWTLTLWFSIAFPTWFVLLAFDMPLTFSDSLFIMGFAAVSSVVPTPGGAAGAFHTATAASLIFLGTEREQAAAVSIAMHLVYFAPAIFFGLYYFFRGDISWTRFKEMLSSSEHPIEEVVEEVEHELDESRVENRESKEKNLTLDSRLSTLD